MNQSRESKTYVFFDAMVFLHCLSIHQMNIPELLGASTIALVVPRVTLQELDKHKNTHELRKIRDRASESLKMIKSCMESSTRELRSGVRLELVARPSRDFEQHGLNIDWPDDQLVANVLKFKMDHPFDRVVLISHDIGPQITATQLGIEAIEIPEKWRIPPEKDPLIKENKRLKNEILKIKNAQPRLILRLSEMQDDDEHIVFDIDRPSEIQVPDKEKIIAELRESYPEEHPPAHDGTSSGTALKIGSFLAKPSSESIPVSEYERYNQELEQYFSNYEKYLDRLTDFGSQPDRTLSLSLEVRNIGGAPAEDVDVYVHFPDGFSLYTENGLPGEPKEPKPPKKPQTATQKALTQALKGFEKYQSMLSFQPSFGPKETFSLKWTKSYELREHFARVKHGYLMKICPLFLIFDSFEVMSSFNFNYEITVGNLPDSITGELNVDIRKKE